MVHLKNIESPDHEGLYKSNSNNISSIKLCLESVWFKGKHNITHLFSLFLDF